MIQFHSSLARPLFFKEFTVSQRFPPKGYFWTWTCTAVDGGGPAGLGRERKPDSQDRRSFVPQWTINRLTQERNSKYSCLNRLKLEGGQGLGQRKEEKERKRKRSKKGTETSSVKSSSLNCIYCYYMYLGKISNQYLNASCPSFKSSAVLGITGEKETLAIKQSSYQ